MSVTPAAGGGWTHESLCTISAINQK